MKQTIEYYRQGLLTKEETAARLEAIGIHGTFDSPNYLYLGYDYQDQQWIKILRSESGFITVKCLSGIVTLSLLASWVISGLF